MIHYIEWFVLAVPKKKNTQGILVCWHSKVEKWALLLLLSTASCRRPFSTKRIGECPSSLK